MDEQAAAIIETGQGERLDLDLAKAMSSEEPCLGIVLCNSDTTLRAFNHDAAVDDADAKRNGGDYQYQLDECQLGNLLERQEWACDAKLLIFAAAASSDRYRSLLVPIPRIYMGDARYDIEHLRRTIACWQSCRKMRHSLRGGVCGIYLLHWVLLSQAQPTLRRLAAPQMQLRRLCPSLRLQRPQKPPSQLLSVCSETREVEEDGRHAYAYFGCQLSLLYRLLATGQLSPEDIATPLLLYAQAEPALAQCIAESSSWPHSRFGYAPRCLLICELLSQTQEQLEYVVMDARCIAVRYLLFYPGYAKQHKQKRKRLVRQSSSQTLCSMKSFDGEAAQCRRHGVFGLVFGYLGTLAGRFRKMLPRRRS